MPINYQDGDNGDVDDESVDVGEYVSSSKSVASIYATDTFEIRLPIANSQFAYLNLSSTESGMIDEMHAPKVTIYGEYGGAKFEWLGEMVRTEAVIDAQSRMLYGVARVKTEYSKGRPPLVVGLFVTAVEQQPLVVNNSGEQVNQRVYDIERRGMHGAMRVITVSRLTRNIVIRRYGVNPDKVTVVYNGVAIDPIEIGIRPIGRREKIVLYFGRITRQKGPEYFIRAAARVLEVESNVRFIVAGSGDLYQRCIELAAELGIGQHFLFTGFLRGADIDKIFAMADLFVMPSVSEPFGIAPLEAMGHDVPVLISKSSW